MALRINFNMIVFYNIYFILYALYVIILALCFLRGNYIFPEDIYNKLLLVLMPWFFFFTWILFGYLLGYFWILKNNIENIDFVNKVYIKSIVVGSIIGIVLAVIYIYIINFL